MKRNNIQLYLNKENTCLAIPRKYSTCLLKENYLSEFDTEEEKELAMENLLLLDKVPTKDSKRLVNSGDLANVLENLENGINSNIENLSTEIGNINEDIEGINEEIGDIKNDVNTIETNISNIETNINDILNEVNNIESDITNIVNNLNIEIFNKLYDPENFSGMGKIYLLKNIVNGINLFVLNMLEDDEGNPLTNTIFVIQYDYYLDNKTIHIPSNCVLLFEGGSLNEGTLVGDNTIIVAAKTKIFSNIIIDGTWNVPEITSTWFNDAEQDNVSRQLFNLTSDNVYNIVTFEKGTFNVSVSQNKEAVYSPKSNTLIVIIGDIQLTINGFIYYFVFDVNNVQNVEITGNGHIRGDYSGDPNNPGHQGDPTEKGYLQHGYGIRITNGSENISVNGLEITNCAGDSIYVGGLGNYETIDDVTYEVTPYSSRITLSNLNLHDSSRQGISITNGSGILVSESHIHDIHGTAPQAGIDIEPNTGNTAENIVISNCTIKGNAGPSVTLAGSHETRRNVRIINCFLDSLGLNNSENVSIENCMIESDKQRMINIHSAVNTTKFDNCYIHNTATEILAEYDCVIQDQSDNIIFNNCTIESDFVPVLTLYGFKNRIIQNCNISSKGDYLFRPGVDVRCREINQCMFTSEKAEEINIVYTTSIENCVFDNKNGFTITIEDGTIEGCRFNGPTWIEFNNNTGSFKNNLVVVSSDTNSAHVVRLKNAEIEGNYLVFSNADNTSIKRILSVSGKSTVKNNRFRTVKNIDYAIQAHTYSGGNKLVIGSNIYEGEFGDILYTSPSIELSYDYTGLRNVGNLSYRPIPDFPGFPYFDTDLGKTIYWNGTRWIDEKGFTANISRGTYELALDLILNNKLTFNDIGYEFYITELERPVYYSLKKLYEYNIKLNYVYKSNLLIENNKYYVEVSSSSGVATSVDVYFSKVNNNPTEEDLISITNNSYIIAPDPSVYPYIYINGINSNRRYIRIYTPTWTESTSNSSEINRIILRKNIVNGENILTQNMINQPNTTYVVQYNFNIKDSEYNYNLDIITVNLTQRTIIDNKRYYYSPTLLNINLSENYNKILKVGEAINSNRNVVYSERKVFTQTEDIYLAKSQDISELSFNLSKEFTSSKNTSVIIDDVTYYITNAISIPSGFTMSTPENYYFLDNTGSTIIGIEENSYTNTTNNSINVCIGSIYDFTEVSYTIESPYIDNVLAQETSIDNNIYFYDTNVNAFNVLSGYTVTVPTKYVVLNSSGTEILFTPTSSNTNYTPVLDTAIRIGELASNYLNISYTVSDCITIPENCTIDFEGGSINNGVLVGTDTTIIAPKTAIFTNIFIGGTWNVPDITSVWFSDAYENNGLKNVFALQDENVLNKIVIEEGDYIVSASVEGESALECLSNLDLYILGNVRLQANSLKSYYNIRCNNASNITISGSGCIFGDRNTHIGTEGEWGMGIGIYKSKFITIKDITIKDCWGDCIYIGGETNPSKEVRVENCFLDNGRRQGISITSAINCIVSNTKIANISGTRPEAGIDIEPNKNCFMENILVSNCRIDNVSGSGISIINGKINNMKNIRLENIEIDGCRSGIGSANTNVDTLSLDNCIVKNYVKFAFFLEGRSAKGTNRNLRNVTMNNCMSDSSGANGLYFEGESAVITNCVAENKVKILREKSVPLTTNIATIINSRLGFIPDQETETPITVLILHKAVLQGCSIECSELTIGRYHTSLDNCKIEAGTINLYSSSLDNCEVDADTINLPSNDSIISNSRIICKKIESDYHYNTILHSTIQMKEGTEVDSDYYLVTLGKYACISNCTIYGNCKVNTWGCVKMNKFDVRTIGFKYIINGGVAGTISDNDIIVSKRDDEEENVKLLGILFIKGLSKVYGNRISGAEKVSAFVHYISNFSSSVLIEGNNIQPLMADTYIPDGPTNIKINELMDLKSGSASDRPVLTVHHAGFGYFNKDNNKTDYWNGTYWVDAAGTQLTWPITFTLSGLTASFTGLPVVNESYQTTLVVKEGFALPTTITVKMGSTTLSVGTDYTYNASTGEITILGTGGVGGVTEYINITATAIESNN